MPTDDIPAQPSVLNTTVLSNFAYIDQLWVVAGLADICTVPVVREELRIGVHAHPYLQSALDTLDDEIPVATISDTYIIGDAHTNTCENRHSFLHQWLAKFRGVSKHHLQKYLDFLALKLNSSEDWFEKPLCYKVSG